jgi:hypothetical protein
MECCCGRGNKRKKMPKLAAIIKAVCGIPGYHCHKQHKISLGVGSIVARRSEANWPLGRPPALAV